MFLVEVSEVSALMAALTHWVRFLSFFKRTADVVATRIIV